MKHFNVGLMIICVISLGFSSGWAEKSQTKSEMKFVDVQKQTVEFIGYYNSIKLTPDQEKIKKDALSSMPAPCCSNFSMATCCCPCNLAKAVWGLSNYLIAKEDYNAEQLKQAVNSWIKFTHKSGHAGDSCSMGRCNAAFHQDGCGGMKENQIVF